MDPGAAASHHAAPTLGRSEAPRAPFRAELRAAAAATYLGVASFGVFHALWISVVPLIFLEGLLHVVVVAPALAWAVRSVRAERPFPHGRAAGLLLGLVIWLCFVPFEVVGLLTGAWPDVRGAADVVRALPLTLLGVPVGATAGWALTRRGGPAAACALAALLLPFYMGGGIAHDGGRGPMLGLFLWLLPTSLAAGLLYMWVRREPGAEGQA